MPPAPPKNFHAFSTIYSSRMARIITDIGLAPVFDPAVTDPATVSFYKTKALWDTGATRSVITNGTAKALALVAVGSVNVNHAGGSSLSPTYIVNFALPNQVYVNGVLVSECHDVAGDFGVIIGMDIITMGDFSITNADGRTLMSFRTPSIRSIDYVGEANQIIFGGTNRNAPCPCGATDSNGKPLKFKFCHGRDINQRPVP